MFLRNAPFLAVVIALNAACVSQSGPPPQRPAADIDKRQSTGSEAAGEPQWENPEWRMLKMATTHRAFVIDVGAARPKDAMTMARPLVEPLEDRYEEGLVRVFPRAEPRDARRDACSGRGPKVTWRS